MAASISPPLFALPDPSNSLSRTAIPVSCHGVRNHLFCSRSNRLMNSRRSASNIHAVDQVSAAADLSRVDLSWQILVGAIAGVTPFVVAGIEFSKNIMAQRTCEVCGGSGLVLREKYYKRCPGCGGFLPWQSWKRFFSG